MASSAPCAVSPSKGKITIGAVLERGLDGVMPSSGPKPTEALLRAGGAESAADSRVENAAPNRVTRRSHENQCEEKKKFLHCETPPNTHSCSPRSPLRQRLHFRGIRSRKPSQPPLLRGRCPRKGCSRSHRGRESRKAGPRSEIPYRFLRGVRERRGKSLRSAPG